MLFVSTPVFLKFQARRRNGRIGPLWDRLILAPRKSGSALHLFFQSCFAKNFFIEICNETIGTVDFALLRAGLFFAFRLAAFESHGSGSYMGLLFFGAVFVHTVFF